VLEGVTFRRNLIELEPVNLPKMVRRTPERLLGKGEGQGKYANH